VLFTGRSSGQLEPLDITKKEPPDYLY
jgi:hypothetical protein